ncbi:UDP-4-amino-4,6-dideoxy-N-acetyl-beta-L-altrosamine transaminase [Akkermansiaceae bacterium]|nr:UDP-4-amino-4,6-dideoxy-N-acetyl-beta-L-altrosamine transaminase [Akkermansiaceae bacterium]MDB4277277.1 UDP-4-amino-4,6-dideoxy-N-acetyl-beta-L-altrosamine transaminase [bacterium]MDB4276259.1 UDP-4-amino-4,6-dideoxy-N-acetyl-beta-L-altrosamine transaminase [Akkermansiaceae bacterium]MDB4282475.1 UDP-4-amino-4,6-dideoxy-N-acetyl-beta-L-altrosamine transaminase [Akkermansiaceae bacterium]MDB4304767.1 UDP-4-amino-4,6-dideoxy-N-acetyl-beta-L-altrosamine transaminase [Akkermansiaceae bacterium]
MAERSFIPYGKQSIDQDDIDAVCAALQSDFLTCGPQIEAFEKAFAQFVGAKHAVVVANATAALHLAMLVAEIGKGDRVITSPNTFLSSANCAAFVGATPDFCDIDSETYTLCPKALEAMWTDDIKAVIAVAYAGQSADMPAIAKLAHERGAIVIEDACHGTGGGFQIDGTSYQQGGHPWADITTFSFHPVKTLTTGEGGILLTESDDYAAQARLLRAHGMTREQEDLQGLGSETPALAEKGPWYYEMQQLGYNFRITDLQCALGISQLKKLPTFIARRRQIVARYNSILSELPWLQTPRLLRPEDESEISWHLYTTQIDFPALGKTRSEVMAELRENSVGSQVLYIPVYLQPFYRETYSYSEGKCPKAEAYYAQALSLPLYPSMSDDDVDHVIQVIKNL